MVLSTYWALLQVFFILVTFYFFGGVGLVFELRVHTCKPGTLLLEPHLQHI
jgi:hypothetical protein